MNEKLRKLINLSNITVSWILFSIILLSIMSPSIIEAQPIQSPLKQFNTGTKSNDVICDKGFYLVIKENDKSPACVKLKSVFSLLERGWASANTDLNHISIDIARNFLSASPTFRFDGIDDGVVFSVIQKDETQFPPTYVVEGKFDTKFSGYGDRKNKTNLAESITQRQIILEITGAKIASAIIDNKWDEINQKFLAGVREETEPLSDTEDEQNNSSGLDPALQKIPYLSFKEALKEIETTYNENNHISFKALYITGLRNSYSIGDPISFRVTEAGYAECSNSFLQITNDERNEKFWEWIISSSCDPQAGNQPILNYLDFAQSGGYVNFPPITEVGNYTVYINSTHDAAVTKKFSVLPSDFVYDHYIEYTRKSNPLDEKTRILGTVIVDLSTGDIKITMPESKTGNGIKTVDTKLSPTSLQVLNDAVDDSGLWGTISYWYETPCQSTDDMVRRFCAESNEHTLNVFWGSYSQFLKWYDGSPDIKKNHLALITEIEKIADAYFTN